MPLTAERVIEALGLEPLPWEGGMFRETYRSRGVYTPEGYPGQRNHSTQIYFMLRSTDASKLHRVRSDEVFHHYMGWPVIQLQLGPGQHSRVVKIGSDLDAGERPQVVAPAGCWQGAVLAGSPSEDAFALLGCSVAPGFDWEDFETADEAEAERLVAGYPEHASVIRRLSGSGGAYGLV